MCRMDYTAIDDVLFESNEMPNEALEGNKV